MAMQVPYRVEDFGKPTSNARQTRKQCNSKNETDDVLGTISVHAKTFMIAARRRRAAFAFSRFSRRCSVVRFGIIIAPFESHVLAS